MKATSPFLSNGLSQDSNYWLESYLLAAILLFVALRVLSQFHLHKFWWLRKSLSSLQEFL